MPIQPTKTEAVISPDRTWTRHASQRLELAAGQTAEIQIDVTYQLYAFQTDDNSATDRYLLVSVEGSAVMPGNLLWNQDDKRGFYTDSVDVEISWFDAKESDVWIAQVAPDSTSLQGAATTSSSLEFGGNAGSFDKVATGGVNVGGSISNSFTLDLSDYTVEAMRSGNKVTHRLSMAMSAGGAYSKPEDLLDSHPTEWAAGLFTDGKLLRPLYGLPPRAVSSLALPSQALFQTAKNFTGKRRLDVIVTHHCATVERIFPSVESHLKKYAAIVDETIDFSLVSGT